MVAGCGAPDSATADDVASGIKHGKCSETSDCASSQYCALTDGCGGTGTCTPKPDFCPQIVAPVCGCDGRSYSNYCYAERAGVTVASNGVCATVASPAPSASPSVSPSPSPGTPSPVACELSSDCEAGQYCETGTSCGEGVCTAKPTFCSELANPVCGCDGSTYANSCIAHADGVSVASSGACACAFSSDNVYASTLAKQPFQTSNHVFTYNFSTVSTKRTSGNFTSTWDPCWAPAGAIHCNIAAMTKSGTFTLSDGALNLTYADDTTASFTVEKDCHAELRIIGLDYHRDITAPAEVTSSN